MKPHLLCLNLNGMVKGGDKAGKKILPLGQGDLDLELLKTIRDSGYRGPIGILGHTQDDAEERLRDNLDGLDWLVPQLDGKPAGPKPKPRTLAALPWQVRLTAGAAPDVEVIGLTTEELGWLRSAKEVNWSAILKVVVGDGKTAIPGSYRVESSVLRFTPRFPLTPGVTYRAIFDPNPIPVHPDVELRAVTADLIVPKPKREPTTVITRGTPDRRPVCPRTPCGGTSTSPPRWPAARRTSTSSCCAATRRWLTRSWNWTRNCGRPTASGSRCCSTPAG